MTISQDGRACMFLLEEVGKSYPGTVALAPLSLEIERGERVAVVGPSGSGKTTLLHLLGRVIQPDRGQVLVDGLPMASLSAGRELAGLVGLIHQQFDLVPRLSVVHNVLAGRLGYWSLWRSLLSLVSPQEKELALTALRTAGIEEKVNERTSRLSGGEQQRVAIARLLVQNPQAILADEPVASLDPTRSMDLLCLLRKIAEQSGKTLVASLHSIELVRANFSRVIGLRKGHLAFDLPVQRVTDEVLDELYDLGGARDSQLAAAS
ncbi:MAG: phosphonate ABC transporter ATP-binding protein [Dehalococcoidia bacterium]